MCNFKLEIVVCLLSEQRLVSGNWNSGLIKNCYVVNFRFLLLLLSFHLKELEIVGLFHCFSTDCNAFRELLKVL